MKCLVLGGNGFLGRYLVPGLVSAGHAVRVFDLPVARGAGMMERPGVQYAYGDFRDVQAVAGALEGCEVVFHLVSATLPKDSNDDPLFDLTSNVGATLGLLELLKERKGTRLVFASSGGTVYGLPQHLPISETHPTEPHSAYGIGKLMIEKYLHLYDRLHGLDYRILRMANLYGEGQSPLRGQGAIAVFVYKALREEPVEIWGNGATVRDYFYVDDAVSACIAAMLHTGEDRVFNIGSGRGATLNRLLAMIGSELGRQVPCIYRPSRGFDVPENVLDCSKARVVLGWLPEVPLNVGVRRMITWFQDQIIRTE